MVKMYHHAKNEVSMSTHSKVTAWTDGRKTHRLTDTQTLRKHYLSAYARGNNTKKEGEGSGNGLLPWTKAHKPQVGGEVMYRSVGQTGCIWAVHSQKARPDVVSFLGQIICGSGMDFLVISSLFFV